MRETNGRTTGWILSACAFTYGRSIACSELMLRAHKATDILPNVAAHFHIHNEISKRAGVVKPSRIALWLASRCARPGETLSDRGPNLLSRTRAEIIYWFSKREDLSHVETKTPRGPRCARQARQRLAT